MGGRGKKISLIAERNLAEKKGVVGYRRKKGVVYNRPQKYRLEKKKTKQTEGKI